MKNVLVFSLCALLFSACTSPQRFSPASTLPEPDASYYFIKGYEAEMSHQWAEAETYYLKALEIDPASPFLNIQRAYLLVRTGKPEDALAILDRVLREWPDNIPALKLKGELFRDLKRYAEAIEIYKRLTVLQPTNIDFGYMLGVIYYYNDELDAAIGVLENIVQSDPGAYRVLDLLASIQLDRKDYDKAEAYLKKALDIKADMDGAYFKLGVIAEMKENLDEAVRMYEEALRINSYNSQARQRLAQAYLKQKTSGKAIEELKIISRQSPGNADIHVRMGLVFFEEKQYDKALEELNTALSMKPTNTMILYYISLVYEETGRYDEAIASLKQVIAREPSNINAFLHLAYIYGAQKKFDDAVRVYEEVITFEKEKPEIYQYYANALLQTRDYRRAETVLDGAVAQFSRNDELLFTRAVVYEKTGRFDDMVVTLRKVIELNPQNAEALNYLGYSYAEKNMHLDEALSLVRRALELKPGNAYYLDSLGWVYYRQGKLEEALGAISKSVETAKDDPVLYEHLGDVYRALGRKERAVEAWKKALPHHEKEEGLRERVEKKIGDLEKELIR